MAEFKVGQTIETSAQQQGLVKYVGPIHVAEGFWLGIELPTPTGKNDGSVRGERYFQCPPGHGLFIRDSNVVRIVSQPAPATPRAAAPKPKPAAAPATARPRPSSVIAPKAAPRVSTINKRLSVAPTSTTTPVRTPVRKSSVAGSSATSVAESTTRTATSGPRPGLSSSGSTQSALRSSRDSNVETLQTKIRHLEKQHTEAQERLKELAQVKDERDRFHNILQKLQTKVQTQHAEAQELKEKVRTLNDDNEHLSKAHQEHEVDLEDALVDKEMAEERADQAESEIESLRKRIEERDLELDILREEAELYTAEMSEEEKQEAGYYRLQHENERLRNALIMLKEVTEEREQDQKARILGLEADVAQLETYQTEYATLLERATQSDAIIEDLKQQLDTANEWEDMVGELSNQNQDFQDRIAEQDLAIQDLENLRELNDELEVQHLEQEEELRAELEVRESELTEQAQRIAEQTNAITDQETLITKFRDLVLDLQSKMADAESSKTLTEAQVKDTTGRFNEVMDLNRQLRTASVQSTTREIDAVLQSLKAEQLSKQLDILYETGSKEFIKSESLQAYLTSERIAGKCALLNNVLTSIVRQFSNGGRLEDALSRLACSEAMSHLSKLKNGSHRLSSAMATSSLSHFANFGPTRQELATIERTLDQGLDAVKADAVNFDELSGPLGRSVRIQEAVLIGHQDALVSRPEDEFASKVASVEAHLAHITHIYELATFALQKAPAPAGEACEDTLEHLVAPTETCKAALAAATKLTRTLQAQRDDGMYPHFSEGIDNIIQRDDGLVQAADQLSVFVRKLIDEILKFSSLSEEESVSAGEIEWIKTSISDLDDSQRTTFSISNISTLYAGLRQWTDHTSVLMNNVEIEHALSPWAQKAKEVEAARKKEDETAKQFQVLTAEHRATVLKIHEREQVIATKELEIEHLLARNRDATARIEDVQALQEELTKRQTKITELQAQNRDQELDLEALKERASRFDHMDLTDTESALKSPTVGAEATEQVALPRAAPAGLKTFVDALQAENHWLRQRKHAQVLDLDVKQVFSRMSLTRETEPSRTHADVLEDLLESTWLSDEESNDSDEDSDEEDDSDAESDASPVQRYQFSRHRVSALALPPVKLGSRLRWAEAEEALLSVVDIEGLEVC
ncbi:hypothetical protein IQ07DRAFT_587775 [Pyrenochaeta sp. DS3sAY3a]|nr:hypothetical protein IQ07DRAFT_587775 [Pyrenochaeta sp. DS3sAY3a]